jgi:hypothetical protein
LTIAGSISSAANSSYKLQFFSDPALAAAAAEGKTYIGSFVANTNALGQANFSLEFDASADGMFVTALATSLTGSTSEFSAPFAVVLA